MNNGLKGILAGAFILLIALLLLTRCRSCDREESPVAPIPDEEIVEEVVEAPAPEPEPEPAPVEEEEMADASEIGEDGVIKVTMQWNFVSDIDLHAEEPNGNHIYFANKGREGGAGGWLDLDDTHGGQGAAENMNWQNPAPGHYRIWVNYFSGRGGGPVKVTVKVGNVTNEYMVNMSRAREDIPIVEFDYPTPGLQPQQPAE